MVSPVGRCDKYHKQPLIIIPVISTEIMNQFDECCDPPRLVIVSDADDPKRKERFWKQDIGQDMSTFNDDLTRDDSKLLRMHQGCLQGPTSQRGILHCCDSTHSLSKLIAKKEDCQIIRDEQSPVLRRLVNSCLALYTGGGKIKNN